jgi:hypothetical protein
MTFFQIYSVAITGLCVVLAVANGMVRQQRDYYRDMARRYAPPESRDYI